MFRACRLVIDTGIHAFNWTKEQAMQYLLDNTAMTPHAVEASFSDFLRVQRISYQGTHSIGETDSSLIFRKLFSMQLQFSRPCMLRIS
jgi:hypothetical protein